MTEDYLYNIGYKKTGENTYSTIDEETGMSVELEFNPNTTQEENERIIDNIIQIVTRQD